MDQIQKGVMEHIIKPTYCLLSSNQRRKLNTLINPTGNFIIGGPVGDCGLTGRKIIVDTYGGMARHGGGAFSGKDPIKGRSVSSLCGKICCKKSRCSRA